MKYNIQGYGYSYLYINGYKTVGMWAWTDTYVHYTLSAGLVRYEPSENHHRLARFAFSGVQLPQDPSRIIVPRRVWNTAGTFS